MIKNLSSYRPEKIYTGHAFFAVDNETNSIVLTKRFDEKKATEVGNYFISFIKKIRSDQYSSAERRQLYMESKNGQLQTASLFLKSMLKRYEKQLSNHPSAFKDHDFLRTLIKLDRYIACAKFSSLTNQGAAMTKEQVMHLFCTEGAKSSLDKWLALKTHKGIKGKVPDEQSSLVASDRAAEAFLAHPEEIDFLHDSSVYKHMSRLSDRIEVDPETLHHRILFEGEKNNVSDILHTPHLDQMIYRQTKGLTPFNAEVWDRLPPFRNRKNGQGPNDYKLVIKTLICEGRQHAWVELKTPEQVYNIGYAWASGASIPGIGPVPFLDTIPGTFSVPDREELSGKDDQFIKTSCRITKEQFEALVNFVETRNSEKPIPYSLTASNCCTFVRELGNVVGLTIGSQENGTRFLTGKHFSFRFSASSFLGKMERQFHKVLAVIRNIVFYCLGGARSQLPNNKGAIFSSFSEVIDPKKGLFDFPSRIYEWQRAVEEDRRSKKEALMQSEAYQRMTEQQQNNAIKELMLQLPTAVQIDEPEDTL